MEGEADWGTVDQQLELPSSRGHPGKPPLIGSARWRPRSRLRRAASIVIIELCLGEGHCCAAESTFRADPSNEPLRASASRAMILGVGPIDDVVATLRQTGSQGNCCPFVHENIRHSPRSRGPKSSGFGHNRGRQSLRSDYRDGGFRLHCGDFVRQDSRRPRRRSGVSLPPPPLSTIGCSCCRSALSLKSEPIAFSIEMSVSDPSPPRAMPTWPG